MTPDPSPPDREGGASTEVPCFPEQFGEAPTGLMCGPRQPGGGDLDVVREFGVWLKNRKQQGPEAGR